MTDRELLELAAKAAGYKVRWHEIWQCFVHVDPVTITKPPTLAGQRMVWVPLDDDGDALRLISTLELNVFYTAGKAYAMQSDDDGTTEKRVAYADAGERDAATRRAIVRAAAEIGMEK